MSIFVGSDSVNEVYVGASTVNEIYVGPDLIWTNIPNVNYAPDQWTAGAAGTEWSFGQLETPPSPSWNTTYAEITHSLAFSGSFITEWSWMEISVTLPVAGDYRVNAVVSAMSSSLTNDNDRVDIDINGFTRGNTLSPGTINTSAVSFSAGATMTIRLTNKFSSVGNSPGQSGYARITSVEIEKVA